MERWTREQARRALVRYQFQQQSLDETLERLRSVQFDPLAPIGCNHDLALLARCPGYRIGQWQESAYGRRHAYDGWDKQACLVPMSGWPIRRVLHRLHATLFGRIFDGHSREVDIVLEELRARGPLAPKDFEFQERKPEWKGSWFGPSLNKQILRALWHSGQVATHSRRAGQHVYDLAERVIPDRWRTVPELDPRDALRAILLERHQGAGMIRPSAPFEVWSLQPEWYDRKAILSELAAVGLIVPVDVAGVKVHVHSSLLEQSQDPIPDPIVTFVAPLDQLVWDRKLVRFLFDFEYLWEVYVPEPKRRWGYYVLPVLFGDRFVARAEFWCRNGVLEGRGWRWEPGDVPADFWPAAEAALARLARYCGAHRIEWPKGTSRELKAAGKKAVASL